MCWRQRGQEGWLMSFPEDNARAKGAVPTMVTGAMPQVQAMLFFIHFNTQTFFGVGVANRFYLLCIRLSVCTMRRCFLFLTLTCVLCERNKNIKPTEPALLSFGHFFLQRWQKRLSRSEVWWKYCKRSIVYVEKVSDVSYIYFIQTSKLNSYIAYINPPKERQIVQIFLSTNNKKPF